MDTTLAPSAKSVPRETLPIVLGEQLSVADLTKVVNWAKHAPQCAAGCRRWLATPAELAKLPVMEHTDILAANRVHHDRQAAIHCASGGTTDRPKPLLHAAHMGVDRVLRSWAPLKQGDVVANLFSPGRLWGAHYFYNALATRSGAGIAPIGQLGRDELMDWIRTLQTLGANVVAGTPTMLLKLAEVLLEQPAQHRIRPRAALWVGEKMPPTTGDRLRELNPQIELWGNYGSMETYVIATNHPACDLNAFHLLPGQCLELSPEGDAYLTRTVEGASTPLLRFRLGDRLRRITCLCGEPAISVGPRRDEAIKFGGALFSVSDLIRIANDMPTVDAAQVLLVPARPEEPHGVQSRLGLRVCSHDDTHGVSAEVRAEMLRKFYDLRLAADSSVFWVETASDLATNRRTGKTLPCVVLSTEADLTGNGQ